LIIETKLLELLTNTNRLYRLVLKYALLLIQSLARITLRHRSSQLAVGDEKQITELSDVFGRLLLDSEIEKKGVEEEEGEENED
jgi:hypothetical protein